MKANKAAFKVVFFTVMLCVGLWVVWGRNDRFATAQESAQADLAGHEEIRSKAGLWIYQLPPISLDIDNADFSSLTEALNKSLGTDFLPPRNGKGNFTLHADHVPFWDLYAQLSQQHPLAFQIQGDRSLHLNLPVMRHYVRKDPFVVYMTALSRRVNPQAQGADATKPHLTVSCIMAVDPRIVLVDAKVPRITMARDARGNDMLLPHYDVSLDLGTEENQPAGPATGPANPRLDQSVPGMWTFGADLRIPDSTAKTSAVIRGEGRFLVALSSSRYEVADAQKHIHETFKVGREIINLADISVLEKAVICNISAHPDAASTDGPETVPHRIDYRLIDNNGKVMWHFVSGGGGSIASISGKFAVPYKLVLTVLNEAQWITIPFEFSDVPIP